MKMYNIALHGCDDSTYFDIELTNEQVELVMKLVTLSEEHSEYGCMPTMECYEKENN